MYELNGPTRICKGIVQQLNMAGEKKTIAVVALTIERFPNNLGSGRPSITQVIDNGEGSSLMSMAQRRFPIESSMF